MTSCNLLLRLLLCLALVLNGAGAAVAATAMHLPHTGGAMAAASIDAAMAHADCADALGDAETGMDGPPDDCCTAALCDLACAAGTAAVIPVPATSWHITPDVPQLQPMLTGHPQRVLQTRYRPPIG